ncbi:MAG: hypothetical protein IKV23_00935 [Bacteroidaceae bacterium]|nr:hypothetical protein [Bacteroidaceae bacterium]
MRSFVQTAVTVCVALMCHTATVYAQTDARTKAQDTALQITTADSTATAPAPAPADSNSRVAQKRKSTQENTRFVPDPEKATWLGVVFPGAGQIYNRKYWKLPIVYGGFIGCLYAYNWNSQMYSDYRQAYLDIMDADPNTDSFKDFFRPGYDFDKNSEYLKNVFKKRKDRYRRWRDLSVFAFIGVYALSVIDAYIDAQLANFDIGDDINITVTPTTLNSSGTTIADGYYGLNLNINF